MPEHLNPVFDAPYQVARKHIELEDTDPLPDLMHNASARNSAWFLQCLEDVLCVVALQRCSLVVVPVEVLVVLLSCCL